MNTPRPQPAKPSTEPLALPPVKDDVEKRVRLLLKAEAGRQASYRERQARENPDRDEPKPGWAEQLHRVVRAKIDKAMSPQDERDGMVGETIAAPLLREIVEQGTAGGKQVPPSVRQTIGRFCAGLGTEDAQSALYRKWNILALAQSVGLAKKPSGIEPDDDTRAFFGSMKNPFATPAETKKEAYVVSKAQLGPRQIQARLESDNALIQESALNQFDLSLDTWIDKPPLGAAARQTHYTDVSHTIGAAQKVIHVVPNMNSERKRELTARMSRATDAIARRQATTT